MAQIEVYSLANAFDSNTSDQNARTIRYIIPASDLTDGTGTTIQIHFGYYNTTWSILQCWVGHQATSGNAWDFDGNQVQLTFNGGSSSSGSISSSVGKDSDEVSFSYDGSKNLIISMYFLSI